jgi:non-canonical purine NTP pyrophosphatase, rdgB/HAM1 family
MKLVFATNNQHKLEEIRKILQTKFEIVSLNEIGCHTDIPETGSTLEENALIKARYVFDNYGLDCFADDTGLEVEALNGEPGVYSARYAGGNGHDSEANMQKLLQKMADKTHRKARFRTVIALITSQQMATQNPSHQTDFQQPHIFEGIVNGRIAYEKSGHEGFGYDPIFIPEGYDKSFAELGIAVKNNISHRARAVQKLANWLLQKK